MSKHPLAGLLEANGMTQQEFADHIGVSIGMVNHIIHGRKRFPLGKIVAAKIALPCTLADLRPDLEGIL
jgi:transcriptional regulator with XRE-family HTH domain